MKYRKMLIAVLIIGTALSSASAIDSESINITCTGSARWSKIDQVCVQACGANYDGLTNVGDPVLLINHIFSDGSAPTCCECIK